MSRVSRAICTCRSRGKVLEGAHVVQAVRELDEHDADVADHREHHLADVLRLALFFASAGEMDLVDLGDPFDDMRDLLAELRADHLGGRGGVFDRIVQQPGGDGGRIELHLGEHLRDFEGMDEVGLAGGAGLTDDDVGERSGRRG